MRRTARSLPFRLPLSLKMIFDVEGVASGKITGLWKVKKL